MSLVKNEQAKLTATYLNGLAIALFALGIFAPLFSSLYSGVISATAVKLFISVVVCFCVSIALHFLARRTLKGLAS